MSQVYFIKKENKKERKKEREKVTLSCPFLEISSHFA
jgi:hypothetical protein